MPAIPDKLADLSDVTGTRGSGKALVDDGTNFVYTPTYTQAQTDAILSGYATTAAVALKLNQSGGNTIYGTQTYVDADDNTRASINGDTGAITASLFTGPGSGLTGLPAANLTGTVPPAILPATVVTTDTTQTISGAKTFSSTIVAPDFRPSGTTSAVFTNDGPNGFKFNGYINAQSGIQTNSGIHSYNTTNTLNIQQYFGATTAVQLAYGSCTASSGTSTAVNINPTDSTTGTGGITALKVNLAGTGTGSGAKLLADFQTAGTSKFSVDSGGAVTSSTTISPGTYTVATLPTAGTSRRMAYASNGRKNGEGAGAGTGVIVFDDGTAWRACDTGATVAA